MFDHFVDTSCYRVKERIKLDRYFMKSYELFHNLLFLSVSFISLKMPAEAIFLYGATERFYLEDFDKICLRIS